MQPPQKRSFWALMVVQFFGAFNDNLLKTLVSLLIVIWVHNAQTRDQLVYFSGVVFVAPFLIFSMVAGRLSDRVGKPRVILGVQIWQLVVVLVAMVSLLAQHIPWMMGALFLLSMQAAFFSPAKYGILPELMDDHELSNANGLFNMGTFTAILLGTVAGSFLALRLGWACGLLIAASVIALASSLTMMPLPAAKPDETWAWNPITDLIANWRLIRQNRSLKLGIIAVNYFWFVGAVLQLNIFIYAKDMLNAGPRFSGLLLIAATIGIGLGSFLAGKFSQHHLELGWVPIGALGMSLFAIDLCWAYHSRDRTLFDLFMMGMSGGFYEVPLNSFVQWHSPKGERGRILATVNFFSFMAILGASGVLYVMGTWLRLDPAQIFGALGFASLAAMGLIVFRTAESRHYFASHLPFR